MAATIANHNVQVLLEEIKMLDVSNCSRILVVERYILKLEQDMRDLRARKPIRIS